MDCCIWILFWILDRFAFVDFVVWILYFTFCLFCMLDLEMIVYIKLGLWICISFYMVSRFSISDCHVDFGFWILDFEVSVCFVCCVCIRCRFRTCIRHYVVRDDSSRTSRLSFMQVLPLSAACMANCVFVCNASSQKTVCVDEYGRSV